MMRHDASHDDGAERGGGGLGARLRAYFFTGVIIVGPLAATAYIAWWFVATVDGMIKPLVPTQFWPDAYLPFTIPGIGVVVALAGLTLLGFLAANLAGRTLLRLGERILDRMPVVRGIYKSLKQVFETIFSQSGSSFRKVGLVQFPAKGMWSLVFISSSPGQMMQEALPSGEIYLSVFLPCTPNPTTGFFFYLPASEVVELAMTPDDAAKLVMSAGLIQPSSPGGALMRRANLDAAQAMRLLELERASASGAIAASGGDVPASGLGRTNGRDA